MKKMTVERNPSFEAALAMMEGDAPFVFVTGRAGTGKSTLLRYFRENTELVCAYLAPTGVAALNVEGETIHGFFRFPPGMSVGEARKKGTSCRSPELYAELDAIVIDEISMVRADLMDCMDQFLRAVTKESRPFGGKRVIAIGDLYQLPPVVLTAERETFATRYRTPYFFSSDVLEELRMRGEIGYVELEKVYRQKDQTFIELLTGVRDRSATLAQLAELNTRVVPSTGDEDAAIVLTSTNAIAIDLNARKLANLPHRAFSFKGLSNGIVNEKDIPTDTELTLKRDARVMFVANDAQGRWVNGTLGTVTKLTADAVTVTTDDGAEHIVDGHTWKLYRMKYDDEERGIAQEHVGSYTQIPLRLAWATTIHKSQGKTFDEVVIDLGRGAFASGQVYVALSRCRTLGGIRLVRPVTYHQLLVDAEVTAFMKSLE